METRIEMYVMRVQDPHEIDKVCPLAFKLHNQRRDALHDIFDNQTYFRVEDWGDTDDETQAHESATIVVSPLATGFNKHLFNIAIEQVGEKLKEKLADEKTSELVKWIINKILPKQEEGKITYVEITINGKNNITLYPQNNSEVEIIVEGEKQIPYRFINS